MHHFVRVCTVLHHFIEILTGYPLKHKMDLLYQYKWDNPSGWKGLVSNLGVDEKVVDPDQLASSEAS